MGLLQQVLNGLLLGAVYTLVAISYSLIMGLLGILNIAIAQMFTFGAYICLMLLAANLPVLPAILISIALTGMLGVLSERIGYRPLKHEPPVMPLLATIGISIFLQDAAVNVWGSEPRQLPPGVFAGKVELGPLLLTTGQIWIIVVALSALAVLSLVIQRTRLGLALRATAENADSASLLGVNVSSTTLWAFFLAGALSGLAGILVFIRYAAVTPFLGLEIALKGIAVMVLGGMNNLWGALLAGPIIGLAEAVAVAHLGGPWRDLTAYGLLLLILVFRPQGLLGTADLQRRRM